MKKLLFIFVLIISTQMSFGQAWTDVGLKVGYGLSLLNNKNLFNDNQYVHEVNGAYSLGAKAGVNIGEFNSITFDIGISQLKQNFNYTVGSNENAVDYQNNIVWKNLDMYLMYRNTRSSAYIEIGPMLSRIKKVTQTDTGANFKDKDTKSFYSDKYLSAVLGFGGYVFGSERFTLMLGLRAHYAFQDMISDAGQKANYPAPFGADKFDTYEKSNPIFIQAVMEFNFGLGFFAKTACTGRLHWF